MSTTPPLSGLPRQLCEAAISRVMAGDPRVIRIRLPGGDWGNYTCIQVFVPSGRYRRITLKYAQVVRNYARQGLRPHRRKYWHSRAVHLVAKNPQLQWLATVHLVSANLNSIAKVRITE